MRGRSDEAEAQLTFVACRRALHFADGFVEVLEQDADLVQQHPACGGQGDRAAVAVEQHHAELVFQFLHGATQRGLGDVEALRGLRVAQLFGHGLEITQMPEIHAAEVNASPA